MTEEFSLFFLSSFFFQCPTYLDVKKFFPYCRKISFFFLSLENVEWIELNNDVKDEEFYISKSDYNLLESFEGALEFCNDIGGLLYEPRDMRITEILSKYIRNVYKVYSLWLGIHDKANEGNFVYASDKSPITWDNWKNGQPDNVIKAPNHHRFYNGTKIDQDCGYIDNQPEWNNQWGDDQCHDLHRFVCVRDKKLSKC